MTTIPDAVPYGELGNALHEFIERLGTDLFDDTWHSMNCSEVEAVAEVMRLGGAVIGEGVEGERAARMVLAQHYDADEYGDLHFMGVGQAVQYIPSPVRHDEPLRSVGGFPRAGVVEEDDLTGIITVRWTDSGTRDNVHVADLETVYAEGEA